MATEKTYDYNLQDIKRYLNGNMTAQEMHDLEKAALTDPLLADAIEGYRNADASVTARHLNDIAARLQNPHRAEAPVVPMSPAGINWKRWMVAAAVAGLLGVSAWWLMNDRAAQTDLAVLSETETTPSAPADRAAAGSNAASVSKDSSSNLQAEGRALMAPQGETSASEEHTKKDEPLVKSKPAAAAAKNMAPIKEDPIAKQLIQVPEVSAATASVQADGARIRSAAPAPAMQRAEAAPRGVFYERRQTANAANGVFTGKITDDEGKPIAGASVVSGNVSAATDVNGKFAFTLPVGADSISDVAISSAGYKNELTTLFAGRIAGIALQPLENNLDEVVVIGYGTKKKATLGKMSDMKVEQMQSIETPYPDGGWASFYDDLLQELGVNKEKANKLLHLKFSIEEGGKPTNFTVLRTPDMLVADRAIAVIKAGPRWKNFQKRKTAEIKMNVE